jgi:hypothetical protein
VIVSFQYFWRLLISGANLKVILVIGFLATMSLLVDIFFICQVVDQYDNTHRGRVLGVKILVYL